MALAALLLVGCGSSGSGSGAQSPPDTTSRPESTLTAQSSTPSVSPAISRPVVEAGEPWVATAWNHLYLLRSDGTDRHILVPELDTPDQDGNYNQPDWSPDGFRLAFEQWVGDIITVWTADTDGGNARQIASCTRPCVQLAYPSWSPDGTKLLMVAYDEENGRWVRTAIQVVDLATGQRETVLETSDETRTFRYPRWSPDGRTVVFQMETYPDGTQTIGTQTSSVIAAVDISGGADQTPRELTAASMWAGYPDWSPTGDRIVFSTYDLSLFQDTEDVSNLYTMKPDGSDVVQVTSFVAGQTRATQPDWAPDGTVDGLLTFTAVDQPRNSARHIAFIEPDGSGLQVLDSTGTHNRLRPTS
jgi:Tol biopolymer transport system component